jgi:hypothetical protein
MKTIIVLSLFLAAASYAEMPAKSNFTQIKFNCVDYYTRQTSDYSALLTASHLRQQDANGNPNPELWTGKSSVIVSRTTPAGIKVVMTMACTDWATIPLGPGDRPGQRNCEQRDSAGKLVHNFFLNLRDVTWELNKQYPFGMGILNIENREDGIFECLPNK